MPIPIPFAAPSKGKAKAPALPPPDAKYIMMALAQMHKEGRLVKPSNKAPLGPAPTQS
jgi:hypothetical protein